MHDQNGDGPDGPADQLAQAWAQLHTLRSEMQQLRTEIDHLASDVLSLERALAESHAMERQLRYELAEQARMPDDRLRQIADIVFDLLHSEPNARLDHEALVTVLQLAGGT